MQLKFFISRHWILCGIEREISDYIFTKPKVLSQSQLEVPPKHLDKPFGVLEQFISSHSEHFIQVAMQVCRATFLLRLCPHRFLANECPDHRLSG